MPNQNRTLNFAHSVKQAVKLFIEDISEDDFKSDFLRMLSEEYGDESSLFLLCNLLRRINWSIPSVSEDKQTKLRIQLFERTLESIFEHNRQSFQSIISKIFEQNNMLGELETILKKLNLSLKVRLFLLVILSDRSSEYVVQQTQEFVVTDLLQSCLQELSTSNQNSLIPSDVFHSLLYFLRNEEGMYVPQDKDKLIASLSTLLQKEELDCNVMPLNPDLHQKRSHFPDLEDIQSYTRKIPNRPILDRLDSKRSLAQVLKECGYICTYNDDFFTRLLNSFHPLPDNERCVAEMIGVFVGTHAGLRTLDHIPFFLASLFKDTDSVPKTESWNIDVFTRVVARVIPTLSWKKVWVMLDHPDFFVPDNAGFELLRQIRATVGSFPMISDLVYRDWTNVKGQVSLFVNSIHWTEAYQEVGSKLLELTFPEREQYGPWNSVRLIQTLLKLSESNYFNDINQLFQISVEMCPSVLLCTLFATQQECVLREELIKELFPMFVFENKINSSEVIKHCWKCNREDFVTYYCTLFERKKHLDKMFDTIKLLDEDALDPFLDLCLAADALQSCQIALDIAVAASRQDLLNLESWVEAQLRTKNKTFAKAAIKYLETNLPNDLNEQTLTLTWLILILNCVYRNSSVLTDVLVQNLKEAHQMYSTAFPSDARLRNIQEDLKQERDERVKNNETMSIEILDNVFKKKVTAKELVQQVKMWEDQDLLGIFIFTLVDEYNYFPNYPEERLEVAAQIFGLFIHHKILKDKALAVAMALIIKALNSSKPDMMQFGITALQLSRETLSSYPDYCQQILGFRTLQELAPDLVDYLQQNLQHESNNPTTMIKTEATENAGASEDSAERVGKAIGSFGAPFSLETLIEKQTEHAIPDDEVRDEVHQLINTLVGDNVEKKSCGFERKIRSQIFRLFCSISCHTARFRRAQSARILQGFSKALQ